jgi:hypothetical protein
VEASVIVKGRRAKKRKEKLTEMKDKFLSLRSKKDSFSVIDGGVSYQLITHRYEDWGMDESSGKGARGRLPSAF